MKKLLALLGLVVLAAGSAYAAPTDPYKDPENTQITTKDMTSEAFLRNSGYSTEAYRIYEQQVGRNVLTPVQVVEKRPNKFVRCVKKVGGQFMETIDPTIDQKQYVNDHDIDYSWNTVQDL